MSAELEYSDRSRRRANLYIAVGVIVALLVGGTVFLALQASGVRDSERMTTRTVVVAAQAVEARSILGAEDVVLRSVVADETNASAYEEVDEVIGRVVGVPLEPGQLVTPNLLATTTAGLGFSILEPGQAFDPEGPDLRAVSVSVTDDAAVGGTLIPGQRVDLVATMPINPIIEPGPENNDVPEASYLAGPSTKVTLQRMTILARNGDLYILRADVATAEKIVELTAAGGVFTMLLRPDEDDRTAETEGSTVDRLIEEFGFPVPEPVDLPDPSASR